MSAAINFDIFDKFLLAAVDLCFMWWHFFIRVKDEVIERLSLIIESCPNEFPVNYFSSFLTIPKRTLQSESPNLLIIYPVNLFI